jgi:hypothetical protein
VIRKGSATDVTDVTDVREVSQKAESRRQNKNAILLLIAIPF